LKTHTRTPDTKLEQEAASLVIVIAIAKRAT
jgi:hypothetical protein